MIKVDMSLSKFERVAEVLKQTKEVQAEVDRYKKLGVFASCSYHGKERRYVIAEAADVKINDIVYTSYILRHGNANDLKRAKSGEILFRVYMDIFNRLRYGKAKETQKRFRTEIDNSQISKFNVDGDDFGLSDFAHELEMKNQETIASLRRSLRVHDDLDKEKSRTIVCNTIDLLIKELTVLKGELN